MASIRWDSLLPELRRTILEFLVQDDSVPLSRFVTVCREWQTLLEPHNFARIKITASRVDDLESMMRRNQHLVRYIWFCLELNTYDCSSCATAQRGYLDSIKEYWLGKLKFLLGGDTDDLIITRSFEKLFSTLSKWDPDKSSGLTLDISIYSPSDSEHWFKYLTFLPDDPSPAQLRQAVSAVNRDDARHGWVGGSRERAPPREAIRKVFQEILAEDMLYSKRGKVQWWDQLPSVPVVTSVLLRQQNRRRWDPLFLYLPLYISKKNKNLQSLVLFENFNQQYPAIVQHQHMHVVGEGEGENNIRIPAPYVSWMVARASRPLEHLAASYLADAGQFFELIRPGWVWPNLKTLVITSTLLEPDGDPDEIGTMLRRAAKVAAAKMPRLEVMEIWNGRKGLAALFRYRADRETRQATISWKASWGGGGGGKFKVMEEKSLHRAWEAVMRGGHGVDDVWSFKVVVHDNCGQDEGDNIKSHADAIEFLNLREVIRPISLHQIRREQRALEEAPFFE
ncbi:hypothetical protein V8F20_007248 [Naviculisporaceae sp. PSN 640]